MVAPPTDLGYLTLLARRVRVTMIVPHSFDPENCVYQLLRCLCPGVSKQ